MEDSKYVSIPYSDLQIEQELGKGSFGKVSKAKYKSADVAIKELILKDLSKESLEEFQQEAKIMAQLHHPNVVQFIGACTEPGHYALVMEYAAKGSLYSLLHSDVEMNWPMRISISLDMGAGLAYLHSQKILHRDLKSLNVLITHDNRAKLTDFGLAKTKHEISSATKNSSAVRSLLWMASESSLLWMAPELFMDEKPHYNQKADIFSYGVTLWEVASRSLPFKDAQNSHIASMWIMNGKRDNIPHGIPPSYATLISACWAQRQEDRPTAEQAVEVLEKLQHNKK